MEFEFHTVDVFARAQFGGNPLAVFPQADGMTGEQMQRIAAEFNLSETTFVLPPKDPAHTAHVRIFTPGHEMPFAGHPNVGTAYVLARLGSVNGHALEADALVFEEKAGLVHIEVSREAGEVAGARIEAPQPLHIGPCAAIDAVARAASLAPADIEVTRRGPVSASCGAAFCFAEVVSREALSRAAPVAAHFKDLVEGDSTTGLHLYCRDAERDDLVHARMFAPEHGIVEDAATGSANVALVALLASLDPRRDARVRFDVIQGADMGRPSYLATEALKEDGKVTRSWVAGQCVPVMRGTLSLSD